MDQAVCCLEADIEEGCLAKTLAGRIAFRVFAILNGWADEVLAALFHSAAIGVSLVLASVALGMREVGILTPDQKTAAIVAAAILTGLMGAAVIVRGLHTHLLILALNRAADLGPRLYFSLPKEMQEEAMEYLEILKDGHLTALLQRRRLRNLATGILAAGSSIVWYVVFR
jgi:hypothetical protein